MIKTMNENAVSPVVGVMLLLIVTIIIAAVVSGFSGGLIDSTGKAPELTMDVHIKNNGYWSGSEFSARVTGVDKAIPTSDLKIVTAWNHEDSDGRVSGGATIMPNEPNVYLIMSPYNGNSFLDAYFYVAPYGYGIGVGDAEGEAGSGAVLGNDPDIHYGNYSLTVGTTMWAEPFGTSTRPTAGAYSGVSQTKVGYGITDSDGNGNRWEYLYSSDTGTSGGAGNGDGYTAKDGRFVGDPDNSTILGKGVDLVFNQPDENGLDGRMQKFYDAINYEDGTDQDSYHTLPNYDAMTAVLGKNWEQLRAGDLVTVSVVHIPTGKTIWEDDVVVEG
jgi:FlaG/FlaF family flagellin (archaellin)